METRKERVKRAAARRRMRDSSLGAGFLQPSADGSNRTFFYIAAGTIIITLVAFLCGVQMGKSLSELRGSGDPGSRVQNRKGQAPPFRLAERGKETQPNPESKPRVSEPGEGQEEKDGISLRPGQKLLKEEAPGPTKDPAPSPPAEEQKTAPARAKYALQVAAFNNPTEAQDLVNLLKKRGYDAYQVTGVGAAKGTLHRVRVGHFQSLQEARQSALAFEKKENMKTIISSVQNLGGNNDWNH